MHHVILGAGPAGVTAAETLRARDRNAQITLVSGENEPPYSRMAIPYFLHGSIGESGTHLRHDKGHYDKLAVAVMHGRAGGIDTTSRELFLSGGKTLKYDRLLLATGASPIMPPMDGANLPGVTSCWTLEDARRIAAAVGKGTPVVLVGAGFIGSIILEALVARGAEVAVVELAPRMVARMMDETAGAMLQRWCEGKGVRVLTGTRVERITAADAEKGTGGLRVWVSNGSALMATVVVMAAGVRPNVGYLVGSNVATRVGVRVDDMLATSAPGVYAAGDCCEGRDMSSGFHDVLAIQPVAVEHGRIAALNMSGHAHRHRGSLNMNVLDAVGLVTASFGAWQGARDGQSARLVDDKGWKYLRLEFEGDRLVGAQSIGLTEHVGMLRGLIQTGTRLGAWKDRLMQAPERVAEAYVALMQGLPSGGPSGPHVKVPAQG